MISAEGAAKVRPCRKCGVEFSGIVCPPCKRERLRKYALENPEKVRQNRASFYARHPERVKAYNSAWRAKNPERFMSMQKAYWSEHLEARRAIARKSKAGLSDGYVASLLGLRVEQIPKELIGLKRVQLQITRHLKEKK